ncbi:MAG TPA: cupin domain-containing protein [Gaiellaceae bacterium]
MTWFVRNLREMKWWDRGPRGFVAELVGDDDAQVGANLFVLAPGQPMSMYHWEADQEDFLVLSGEALLIVEDGERPLLQWDFFHCPKGVPHTIVGAGSGPSAILALGAREKQAGRDWGGYPYSELAMKHDASAEEETTNPNVAYARFPDRREGEFREDWLP